MTANRFSAKAAALGYSYQYRYALWTALDRHQTGVGWSISVETIDDLVTESDGERLDLLQLKHRADGTTITDGAPDLWKSIRIWAEAFARGQFTFTDYNLYLVTTSNVAAASACEKLAADSEARDNASIAAALRTTAAESENESLQPAFKAFLDLSEADAKSLISRVHLLPQSHNIEDAGDKIRAIARYAAREEHLDAFVERLEGWWNARCIEQLLEHSPQVVTGVEFDGFISDLRDQFRGDNLPIDEDVLTDYPEVSEFLDHMFCKQLDLIDIAPSRIAIAVREFHRAFVQRSRWSHRGLIEFGELGRYENRLREEWEIIFEQKKDELGPAAAEANMLNVAKAVYNWAETVTCPIRPACTEGFVSRGTLHKLADDLEIGWHPEFELRLATAIEPELAD